MSDTITKAREAEAKWRAAVDRARAEVTRREAFGRPTKALDRARAQLARAERLAAAATERVETLARKARAEEARAARRAAATVSMERRFGRLATIAPAAIARWEGERAAEADALAKRRKALAHRTTVDLRHPGRMDFSSADAPSQPPAPPPAYMPSPSDAPKPPREGLIPGEFKMLPVGQLMPASPKRLTRWTAERVAERLVEAHDVLRRLPMTTRPKAYGAIWPEYTHDAGELAVQAGAGTIGLGRNRVRMSTTADEIARMNEVLGWLLEFQAVAPALNAWAFNAAHANRDGILSGHEPPGALISDLKMIADALNARGVVVR